MGQINPELVVQSLSRVWLFVTPWTAACQASPFFTVSQSLPKLMSIESLTLSNHLILCRPLLLPSIFLSMRIFSRSQFFTSGGQSTGVSASVSVLPMNIQDWSPLGWTGLISLQSMGLSRVFSSTTVQKHPFFRAQPHSGTWWPAPHGATTGFSDAGPKASRDWPQNTLLLDFTP